MANESTPVLRSKLDRAKSTIANLKQESARVTRLGTHSALMTAGGFVAGALDSKLPKVPGTDIETKLAGGVLLTTVAVFDWAGEYSDELLAIGGGMLAVSAAEFAKDTLAR